MRESVLKALIEKWVNDSESPECEDGSESARIGNARAEGVRNGIAICANNLCDLIKLLGTEEDHTLSTMKVSK